MMRLTVTLKILPLFLLPLLSCDEAAELFPPHCNCDIEALQLSETSIVTYQVSTLDGASVASITYQTNNGPVTVVRPALPFNKTVPLAKGETVALKAIGDPTDASILLTYEIENSNPSVNALSSSVSKVWIVKDGICQ